VRSPARRAQPAVHTTRVWTGPAGCPVAPSSPRLCLRPDAACGLAKDLLKRRRRQGNQEDKTANGQQPDTVVRLVPPLFSWCSNLYAGLRDGGFRERFAQTCRSKCGHVPERLPDRADGAATGLYSRRSRTEAAFTGLRPAPHPVAALSLSVALGRDPAVAPTPHAPAVNRYVGRVTSLEKLYPDVWLTFNTLCKQNRGWIEFRQGANNPPPGTLVRRPENLTPARAWGFRICGTAKRVRILQAESHDLQTQA
jgi:hypothetical protein